MTHRTLRAYAGALLLSVLFSATAGCDSPARPEKRTTQQPVAQKAAAIPAIATRERVDFEVREAFRTVPASMATDQSVQVDGATLRVQFLLDGDLASEPVRECARRVVVDVLKAVQRSQYDYGDIAIRALAHRLNAQGVLSVTDVLRASYPRSTVDSIDWAALDPAAIYTLAASVWLYPSLR